LLFFITVEFVSSKKRPFSNGSLERLNVVKPKLIVNTNNNKSITYFKGRFTIAYNGQGFMQVGNVVPSSPAY